MFSIFRPTRSGGLRQDLQRADLTACTQLQGGGYRSHEWGHLHSVERAPKVVTVDGRPLDPSQDSHAGRTLLIRFVNSAHPKIIELDF